MANRDAPHSWPGEEVPGPQDGVAPAQFADPRLDQRPFHAVEDPERAARGDRNEHVRLGGDAARIEIHDRLRRPGRNRLRSVGRRRGGGAGAITRAEWTRSIGLPRWKWSRAKRHRSLKGNARTHNKARRTEPRSRSIRRTTGAPIDATSIRRQKTNRRIHSSS